MGGQKQTSSGTSIQDLNELSQVIMNPMVAEAAMRGYEGLGQYAGNLLGSPYSYKYSAPPQYSGPAALQGASDPRDVALVNAMYAQGVQGIRGQEAAQNRNLAQALMSAGGNNQAMLAGLTRQGGLQSLGAMNALLPATMEQQRAYDMQRAGLRAQENEQNLAFQQARANTGLGYQQAQAQTDLASRGMQMQGLANAAGLLESLNKFGALTGRQVGQRASTSQESSKTKTGFTL